MTAGKSNKILIVDDHEETRQMYAEVFRDKGFEVLEAKDGVEGLDIATSGDDINLIFTGIIMPRMDGFQLIESLKEHTHTAGIPVVANSHLGREEDRIKMSELGAKDFIVRGVTTPAEAVQRVNQVMNQGEYLIKADFLGLEGQKFIEDFKLPEDGKCLNCATDLAIKVKYGKEKKLRGKIICPNCSKTY